MAAQAERPLHFLVHAISRENMLTALYGCVGLVAVVIGVLGLLADSWPRHLLESWINIHALFALLLCGLVFSRGRWCVTHSPRMQPADVRDLSRHLSRIVYLLLYVVIGARQIVGVLNSIWHGGAVDFNLFSEHLRNGPDSPTWNPKDDFQLFLGTGFSVLVIIRVVAFRLWLRAVERAALSKEAPGFTESRVSNDLAEPVIGRTWSGQGFPPANTPENYAVTKTRYSE